VTTCTWLSVSASEALLSLSLPSLPSLPADARPE
jgi:hypothetical protein